MNNLEVTGFKELSEQELKKVEGGSILELIEAVYECFTGEGPVGHTCMYANYYRSQMPSNWTGHGYQYVPIIYELYQLTAKAVADRVVLRLSQAIHY